MNIQLLPPQVASQIAAGEVIERPASAVKELIENALDSGASQISVTVEGAGQRLVEVYDDGQGIAADELTLAVSRHATSKLRQAEDLFHIMTLGFRGEALASIGSVARLTLVSRTSQTDEGARLCMEGGNILEIKATGAPQGTLVRVEDLFYNVPARLKFLKHAQTERRLIESLVTHYAMAYPAVRFTLKQEGRISQRTSGNGDRREILATLYGVEIARQMVEVVNKEEGFSLTGYISPVSLTRSNRRDITFFVNGRPVQDAFLTTALVQAYHTYLMVGRYPIAFLFIDVPPEEIDVNVHPTKAEIRFRNTDRMFSAIQHGVRRALLAYSPVPSWRSGTYPPENAMDNQAQMMGFGLGSFAPDEINATPLDNISTEIANPPELPTQGTPRNIPILRLIGQVATTYIVAEGPDGLYLIDQHAAHERVLFEQMLAQKKDEVISQILLEPAAVSLPPAQARLLEEQLPLIRSLGFDVELFGVGTYLVRSVPSLLAGIEPARALQVLVNDFEEDERPLSTMIEARLVARICKQAAVKAGQVLSVEEQRALLQGLEACRSPRTCPHGRPTMIHLSVDLLERQFGRKGSR